eukprot:TRINITY_DN9076_c0_g1_i1.p1 TRINITY_DN9076_c0_g1~~TRINITY_DN9076_c0_g1_i1.p1  ORF type:complete len:211 (-),score=23.07 TRINITY_DN9076_c0_g1_i1:101-733(-)
MWSETYHCMLLGPSESGKSSFAVQYTTDRFPTTRPNPGIGDPPARAIDLQDPERRALVVLDDQWVTEEENGHVYQRIQSTTASPRKGEALILIIMYSMAKRDQFATVEPCFQRIKEAVGTNRFPPVFIVGTCKDVQGDNPVLPAEAEDLAKRLGVNQFQIASTNRDEVASLMQFVVDQAKAVYGFPIKENDQESAAHHSHHHDSHKCTVQ